MATISTARPNRSPNSSNGDGGRDGGGADVDQGDADQEGHQQLVRALDEGSGGRPRLGLGGQPLESAAAEREVRRLGAGEQGRAEDENDQGEQRRASRREVLEPAGEGDLVSVAVEERHAAARIDDLADGVEVDARWHPPGRQLARSQALRPAREEKLVVLAAAGGPGQRVAATGGGDPPDRRRSRERGSRSMRAPTALSSAEVSRGR